MNSVRILRALTRHPLILAQVVLLSIVVGWLVGFRPTFPPKSRSYTVAIASERVLIDTPQSQVLEVSPAGSGTLGTRASVFANLLVVGELKNEVAKRAGLAPNKLLGSTDASATAGSAGAGDATKAAPTTARLHTSVLLSSDQVQLPIIKVDAQATSPVLAARITSAATETLSSYVSKKAASEGVSADKRLNIRSLGAPVVDQEIRGPRHLLALLAGLFILILGCAAIVLVPAFIRAWRLSEAEDEPDDTDDETAAEAEAAEADAEVEVKASKRMAAATGRV
jgi:hypothetical protein